MTRKYRLSKRADIGLAKIWRNIADNNMEAANALYDRILHKIENAAQYTGIGTPQPDIGKNVRMLVEGNYNIYYVLSGDNVVVTAIVHSKRLPANWH